MNNLAVTNTDDFTITENGDAFISQTQIALLCGVGQNAISMHIRKTHDTLNINENSQLSHNSLELVIGHYAFDSERTTDKAMESYRILAKAGAKAFIYHQAGYTIKPEKLIKPPTALELARENVRLLEAIESKDQLIIAGNEANIKAGEISVREFVKSNDAINIGGTKFLEWMRANNIIMQNARQPMQAYVDNGWLTWKFSEEALNGEKRRELKVTPRGQLALAKKYMIFRGIHLENLQQVLGLEEQ